MYNVQEDVDEFQNFLMWTKSLCLIISMLISVKFNFFIGCSHTARVMWWQAILGIELEGSPKRLKIVWQA